MITVDTTPDGDIISGHQVRLRPVTVGDLEMLRGWRNSEFVSNQMLSSDTISPGQQQQWFERIQSDNGQRHWVVEYRGEPIGATNVKAASGSVAQAKTLEPGLYIGDARYQGNILAFAPTLALYDYCFEHLRTIGFEAVVKAQNVPALKYNQQLGYNVVAEQDLVELYLHKDNYQRQTKRLKQLFSRSRKS